MRARETQTVLEWNVLSRVSVFIVFCYLTSDLKLRDLKPHIYYLTVAVHQESRHNLTGSSVYSLTRLLDIKLQQELWCYLTREGCTLISLKLLAEFSSF